MPSFLSTLTQKERNELLSDLNYLNLTEIKQFCKKNSIPYRIVARRDDGRRRQTPDDDRKGVVLNRVRHFLKTGLVLPETCLPSSVVCLDPTPKRLTANDRLFYGQYHKTNAAMMTLLKRLTAGKFRDGAIARMVARKFWTNGKAPTFQQYASAWLKGVREHTRPNPEWAFLSDRANNTAPSNWKQLRAARAKRAMRVLDRVRSARPF
jgi:hypothetical protein